MTHRIPEDAIEVTASELRVNLRDYLERVAFAEDELVITRAGRAMAALISMDAYIALRQLMAAREDMVDGQAARAAQKLGDYVKLEDLIKGSEDGP